MIRKCDIKVGLTFRLRLYNMWMDGDYVRDRDGNVVTFTLTGFFKSSKGRKYAATDFEWTEGHYIAFPFDVFRIKELDPGKSELMAVPVEEKNKKKKVFDDESVPACGWGWPATEDIIQALEERMTNLVNKEEGMDKNNRLIPEDHVRFKGIVDRMYDTFKRKNADYGNSFGELYKECGMMYAYGHMKEKLERVRSLMKNEAQVKGESMKDSLYDLANYAVLTIMEIERSGHGGVETPPHEDD